MNFYDFEDDLQKNMFNASFLKNYNEKMYCHLIELFDTNKCAICSFLDSEYHYGGETGTRGKHGMFPSLNKCITKKTLKYIK